MWKSKMTGVGGNKKRVQYCIDPSGQEILYLRALQGKFRTQSHWSFTTRQCVNSGNFFEDINHIGCATSLHSITNSGLILGGQILSNRQTILFFVPWTRVTRIRKSLIWPNHDLRRTRKWKKHQDTVYWIDINLAQSKRFKFFYTRRNAIILNDTLPAYCISKVVVMKSGKVIYEKVCLSPRPPPEDSFKDNWMEELDSEVAGSNEDSQRIQPKPKTRLSRTETPVDGPPSSQSCWTSTKTQIEQECADPWVDNRSPSSRK